MPCPPPGDFLTQGSNQTPLPCRLILYRWAPKEACSKWSGQVITFPLLSFSLKIFSRWTTEFRLGGIFNIEWKWNRPRREKDPKFVYIKIASNFPVVIKRVRDLNSYFTDTDIDISTEILVLVDWKNNNKIFLPKLNFAISFFTLP